VSLDATSLGMIDPYIAGAAVLCLGYPEHPERVNTVRWLREKGATEVDVVDVIRHFGIERVIDLNEPQEWPRAYGLVINPGTLEHCFNIGVAWANVWRALAVGGVVMHVAPATMLNHGFWNVSPIALHDWCGANGGKIIDLRFALNGKGTAVIPERQENVATGRQRLPSEVVMYGLCERTAVLPMTWPSQGKYRR
jgi:hypothetical protein